MEALQTAIKLDPGFDVTYVYLGGVHGNMGDFAAADRRFQHALAINPHNETAAQSSRECGGRPGNRR